MCIYIYIHTYIYTYIHTCFCVCIPTLLRECVGFVRNNRLPSFPPFKHMAIHGAFCDHMLALTGEHPPSWNHKWLKNEIWPMYCIDIPQKNPTIVPCFVVELRKPIKTFRKPCFSKCWCFISIHVHIWSNCHAFHIYIYVYICYRYYIWIFIYLFGGCSKIPLSARGPSSRINNNICICIYIYMYKYITI